MSLRLNNNINYSDTHNQVSNGSRIYYNLKFANIYENKDNPKPFAVRDDTSVILDKQNNYRLAIQSFRLDVVLPVFLFPIKEGFVYTNNILISNITNANPAVITTTAPHNLNNNDYIQLKNIVGMIQMNNRFFVDNVLSPTQFTVKTSLDTGLIDSTKYNTYISNGEVGTVNDNINLSDFGLCLEFSTSTNNYPSSIIYIPDKNLPNNPQLLPKTPKKNNGVQDKTTFYYYTFSFEVFAEMLNNALISSMTALNAAEGTNFDPPYYIYNNDTNKFELVVPFALLNLVNIYVNTPLNNYIVGFRTEFQIENSPEFKDYKYIIKNYQYNNSYVQPGQILPVPPADPLFLIFKQEYDGRFKFDEISSLVITSNYIRTRNEYFPKVGNPNSYSQVGRAGNNFNTGTSNIISSFDLLDSEGGISWREVQYYSPKIYKWIDLISDDPLTKIDAQILFETKKGDLLPVFVDSGSFSNIRLLFEKIN